MSKKTEALTEFDNQLITGMEEVVAHINGESTKAVRRLLSLPMRKRSEVCWKTTAAASATAPVRSGL